MVKWRTARIDRRGHERGDGALFRKKAKHPQRQSRTPGAWRCTGSSTAPEYNNTVRDSASTSIQIVGGFFRPPKWDKRRNEKKERWRGKRDGRSVHKGTPTRERRRALFAPRVIALEPVKPAETASSRRV